MTKVYNKNVPALGHTSETGNSTQGKYLYKNVIEYREFVMF